MSIERLKPRADALHSSGVVVADLSGGSRAGLGSYSQFQVGRDWKCTSDQRSCSKRAKIRQSSGLSDENSPSLLKSEIRLRLEDLLAGRVKIRRRNE